MLAPVDTYDEVMEDLKNFYEPISPESEAGENLEYDPRFLEMQRHSDGVREQQYGDTIIAASPPDWTSAFTLATNLCHETRDLRIAVLMIEAMTHSGGTEGLSAGVDLLEHWVENYWPSIHPPLDSADGNDPFMRINCLGRLCEHDRLPTILGRSVLFEAPPHYEVRCDDLLPANGDTSTRKLDQLSSMEVEAAILSVPLATVRLVFQSIENVRNKLDRIVGLLEQQTNPGIWDTEPLTSKLDSLLRTLKKHLRTRLAANDKVVTRVTSDLPDPEPGREAIDIVPCPPESNSNQNDDPILISSRDQAIEAIDAVTNYFLRHEPSSPVPLLLRRARKLVKQDFVEIIRELAPGALAECQQITGKDEIDE